MKSCFVELKIKDPETYKRMLESGQLKKDMQDCGIEIIDQDEIVAALKVLRNAVNDLPAG